ncbi:aspartate--tRNA ligase dps1 [Umbelopsis nana]
MSAEEQTTAQVDEIIQQTENIVLGEDGKPLSKKALKKLEKEREKAARKAETAARVAQEQAASNTPDYSVGKYGKLPMNQSQERTGRPREDITKINASRHGETVLIRARVQTSRAKSSKLCFFVFRQGVSTIQGILDIDADKVSKQMVKFGSNISAESIVLVEAEIVKAAEEVKSCTISDAELKISQIHVIAEAEPRLPFTMEDASRPESELENEDAQFSRVALDTRLNNRVLDLRTTTGNAIFKIQSGVCHLFRDFLYKRGFIEIHTPKIIATPSEGGANVFSIKYFNTEAYLAQSPQLYKQMAISGDFNRVFEIGPVFRAENSNTHRHMTEFVGLDMEMAFEEHYHEVLDVLDEMFVSIFTGLKELFNTELEAVKRQMPFEDFQFLPKTLRLKYADGIAMLRNAGVEIGDYDDLSTEQERFLGRLVKEKYHTDFYMLDKFPLAIRPFYTMPDPENPNYSNSYDFFMRGEEILSGAQRIHDAKFLEERCKAHGVDMNHIQPYIEAFKIAAPPHAGGGIGLERVVMLYMGLGNIRRSSLFPRDPKRLEP